MAALDDLVQDVTRLAGMIPGIVVRGHEVSASEVRIFIAGKDTDSIGALQFSALSANVEVEPWVKDLPSGAQSEQTLFAKTRLRDGLEFGELQILGVHLVRHLKRVGLLPAHEANRLLAKWSAAPVGEP